MEIKTFLANPKHEYRVSQFGEHNCSAHRMETNTSIKVYLIPHVNIKYLEKGGRKSFSCKSIALILCIPIWKT